MSPGGQKTREPGVIPGNLQQFLRNGLWSMGNREATKALWKSEHYSDVMLLRTFLFSSITHVICAY